MSLDEAQKHVALEQMRHDTGQRKAKSTDGPISEMTRAASSLVVKLTPVSTRRTRERPLMIDGGHVLKISFECNGYAPDQHRHAADTGESIRHWRERQGRKSPVKMRDQVAGQRRIMLG